MDWSNILERAAWTFLEGFLVALPLGGDKLDRAALMGALMAGLSALKTFAVEWIRSRRENE